MKKKTYTQIDKPFYTLINRKKKKQLNRSKHCYFMGSLFVNLIKYRILKPKIIVDSCLYDLVYFDELL